MPRIPMCPMHVSGGPCPPSPRFSRPPPPLQRAMPSIASARVPYPQGTSSAWHATSAVPLPDLCPYSFLSPPPPGLLLCVAWLALPATAQVVPTWTSGVPATAFTAYLTLDANSSNIFAMLKIDLSTYLSDPNSTLVNFANQTFAINFGLSISNYLNEQSSPSFKGKLLNVSLPYFYLEPRPAGAWKASFYLNGSSITVFSSLQFTADTEPADVYAAFQR